MSVETVKGSSVRDALLKARAAHGDLAVVISRKETPGGIVLAVSPQIPRSPQALQALQYEARLLLAKPITLASSAGTSELQRCLLKTGASRLLIERTVEAVEDRLDEGVHPLDLAAEELATTIPIARLRLRGGRPVVLALLGSAGAGKSTTAAKLAGRLKAVGRSTALVSIDLERPGARAELSANGRALGIPVAPTPDASRIAILLGAEPDIQCIVLDMTGRIENDLDQLKRLREALIRNNQEADVIPIAVLPATSSAQAQEQFLESIAEAHPMGSVITKLDECSAPAPTLELCSGKNLGILFLSAGRDLNRDLVAATGEGLADLLLRGRVS